MRPTRWTRKRRVTKFGKGGWNYWPFLGMWQYTNPVTGNGYTGDSLRVTLALRRIGEARERERAIEQSLKGVTWEP